MKGQKGGIPSTDNSDIHKLDLLGHELGNVLHGLLGMAELLADSRLDTKQDRWLRAIAQSAEHMQSLIRSFRFFQGTPGLDFIPCPSQVDGVELLEQVIISHTPAANSRNNQLLLISDRAVPRHWFCDACLIRQLLDNLVSNAAKFTGGGEIVLEAAVAPGADAGSEALVFRVSDNGKGVGVGSEQEIFEAFSRGHDKVEDGPGNRGLGLFICREIVRSMNGRISCFGRKGGGSCFEIMLPEALAVREACPPFLRSSLLAQIRVCLQLDNKLRQSVQSLLDRLGVRGCPSPAAEHRVPQTGLALVISEAATSHGKHLPCLLLSPWTAVGKAPCSRLLEAPVLESSLGLALLEIALEWRSLEIRNEKPGSTPTRR